MENVKALLSTEVESRAWIHIMGVTPCASETSGSRHTYIDMAASAVSLVYTGTSTTD